MDKSRTDGLVDGTSDVVGFEVGLLDCLLEGATVVFLDGFSVETGDRAKGYMLGN